MSIFETHCHLNHPQFATDCDEVIVRAVDSKVRRLLVVSYDLTSSRLAVELAKSHEILSAAVGIHPEDANEWSVKASSELSDLCLNNRQEVVAWGEIGLDYHWETIDRTVQRAVFAEQLKVAKDLDLPVIVHCRDAYDDTLQLLSDCGVSRAVVHCFTGTLAQAIRATELGYYVGIGGIVTYKNAGDLRQIVADIPLDRILAETDSPFLPPQPWRGKRNEPAHITAVVSKIAEIREKSVLEIEETTFHNAEELFGSTAIRKTSYPPAA